MGEFDMEERVQELSSSVPKPESGQHRPGSITQQRRHLKLPQISQFTIACYAGFISLAALYVAHSSANTSADAALLANQIATAGLVQAQVANQIQLLQLCLVNSTVLIDACEGVLQPAATLVPKIVAFSTTQYGTAAANDQIKARFVRELMGFHIGFFSLLAIAVIHAVVSLWRPVKDYIGQGRSVRSRESDEGLQGRSMRSHESDEGLQGDSEDGPVDRRRAGVICAMAADQSGGWQQGHLEMARMPSGAPCSPGHGAA